MAECGFETRPHYLRVRDGGQCAIDLNPKSILSRARSGHVAKYIHPQLREADRQDRRLLAKPLWRNGSGRPRISRLWTRGEKPLLAGTAIAGRSGDLGMSAIGGWSARRRPQTLRVRNPTTNRLQAHGRRVRGARPSAYSRRNRAAVIRIRSKPNSKSRRIEYRGPDSAANPSLVSMLMAALDGIQARCARAITRQGYLRP